MGTLHSIENSASVLYSEFSADLIHEAPLSLEPSLRMKRLATYAVGEIRPLICACDVPSPSWKNSESDWHLRQLGAASSPVGLF